LLQGKEEKEIDNVALVRLEQIYPLPEIKLGKLAEKYKGAEWLWVQEEPKNMGAWTFLLRYEWPQGLRNLSRKSSSTPATGYSHVHKREQAELVRRALSLE